MQLSLLDQFEPTPDAAFRSVLRRDLGQGAWVEYAPAWLSGHLRFMDELIATCDWQRHRRNMYDRIVEVPRLVAAAPGSKRSMDWNLAEVELQRSRATPEHIECASRRVAELGAILSVRYGRVLSNISLGYYRDGSDSVSFHGDKLGTLRSDTVVAIVSVGDPRRFLLRPVGGGRSCSFRFGAGDLLVMGGSCQQTFEHAVPKMQGAGPRVALMFREELPKLAPARHRITVEDRPLSAAGSNFQTTKW